MTATNTPSAEMGGEGTRPIVFDQEGYEFDRIENLRSEIGQELTDPILARASEEIDRKVPPLTDRDRVEIERNSQECLRTLSEKLFLFENAFIYRNTLLIAKNQNEAAALSRPSEEQALALDGAHELADYDRLPAERYFDHLMVGRQYAIVGRELSREFLDICFKRDLQHGYMLSKRSAQVMHTINTFSYSLEDSSGPTFDTLIQRIAVFANGYRPDKAFSLINGFLARKEQQESGTGPFSDPETRRDFLEWLLADYTLEKFYDEHGRPMPGVLVTTEVLDWSDFLRGKLINSGQMRGDVFENLHVIEKSPLVGKILDKMADPTEAKALPAASE